MSIPKLLIITLLIFSVTACKQDPQYDPDPNVPQSVMIKTKQDLPLLSEPNPQAASLHTVPAGAELMADDVSGQYVRVAYNNNKGWLETVHLMFREDGRAFLEHKSQKKPSYADRRRRMNNKGGSGVGLQQCAHTDPASGRRCLYQTADESGNCPEHQ